MANLFAAATGGALADPALTLKTFIVANWTLTGTLAMTTRVRVDTKWDNLSLSNQIIIKEVTTSVETETLGTTRWSNVAHFRIGIWSAEVASAYANVYSMRKELQRIFQTSALGMFSSGIERALVADVEKIETGLPDAKLNDGIAIDSTKIARSSILIDLYFTEVVV